MRSHTTQEKNDHTSRPLVSIIIPAYNAQRTLHQALDSALGQTYREIEVLIIDDNSSDRTAEIACAYAQKDSRVRLIHNEENQGVARTRNLGVKEARGQWIAFLDSDDAWSEDKLKRQLSCAERTQGKFIFTGSAFMDAEGNRKIGILHVPEKVTYRELLKQNIISCSSVLIRRELMIRHKMPTRPLHEDFAVWLQILREGESAYGVDEPLLTYRLSAGSKSGNKWKAARMTYRVYRYIGLGCPASLYYWGHYLFKSVKKYSRLL